MREAVFTFLESLVDTGSRVAIIDFATTASYAVGGVGAPELFIEVTPDSLTNVFDPYLTWGYLPSGFTNWEGALKLARDINTAAGPGNHAPLVFFFTDGNPNTVDPGSLVGEVPALAAAIPVASGPGAPVV